MVENMHNTFFQVLNDILNQPFKHRLVKSKENHFGFFPHLKRLGSNNAYKAQLYGKYMLIGSSIKQYSLLNLIFIIIIIL